MEFLGSGGIVLVVLAVLWLGFLTPTGQKGLQDRQPRAKRQARSLKTVAVSRKTRNLPRYRVITGVQAGSITEKIVEKAAEKVIISPLPDPLSARLGTLENVSWAEVHPIEKLREEKEKVSAESLDEILKRRRSNG
jgi:hypothetical protein